MTIMSNSPSVPENLMTRSVSACVCFCVCVSVHERASMTLCVHTHCRAEGFFEVEMRGINIQRYELMCVFL